MRLKAAVCVLVIAISFGSASVAGEDCAADLREKQALITSVNLLNGLHLSGEQMQRLLEINREAERMLTEGQQRTLATFKPCLIPPRDLREPARAGQASAASRGARVLETYRKMMQRAEEVEKQARVRDAYRNSAGRNRYRPRAYRQNPRLFVRNRMRDAFAERFFPRYFEWVEHTGELSENEKSAEKKRILKVFDRGAAMSDEEFSLGLDQLSQEVFTTLEAREGELREAMNVLAGRPGVPGRAARFLISPGVIPILEQRADKFAEGVNRQ